MRSNPKRSQIVLPRGVPDGICIAEFTNRSAQGIQARRSQLADVPAMKRSSQLKRG